MTEIYTQISRRALIKGAASMAALSFLRPWTGASAAEAPIFLNDPFSMGVASGDPMPDSVMLWTRLAPDPLDPEAMAPHPIVVDYEIASDDSMRQIVQAGRTISRPDAAHAVHLEVRGLDPARDYWYRFRAGEAVSPIGRTRTMPKLWARADHLRFGVASCQHYTRGYYIAYRDMVAHNPDLILHLGDYIYEYDPAADEVRHLPIPLAKTLEEYRLIYAVTKMDPDLKAAHAAAPWIMTWDDHEVENDYAGNNSWLHTDPKEFVKQKLAGYRAYFEHMPLRLNARPIRGEARIYQQAVYGDLVNFSVVDGRQYRADQACERPDQTRFGGQITDCDEVRDPSRTRLGPDQEFWLRGSLVSNKATWDVLAQTTLFSGFRQFDRNGDPGVFTDGWDGYPAARQRILDMVVAGKPKNFVVLGGDIHNDFVCDVHARPLDMDSPVIGAEFTGTSISTPNRDVVAKNFQEWAPLNPHMKFVGHNERGYLLCDVTHDRWLTTLRTVDNARDRNSGFGQTGEFVVENGRPGVQKAG